MGASEYYECMGESGFERYLTDDNFIKICAENWEAQAYLAAGRHRGPDL